MSRTLGSSEYEDFSWSGKFQFPDMVRIGVVHDGSGSLIHALLQGFSRDYNSGTIGSRRVGVSYKPKYQQAQEYRESLPTMLMLTDASGRSGYDALRTQIPLQEMVEKLTGNIPLDPVYFEFLSNVMKKDIYILDMLGEDVYYFNYDRSRLYKGRDSIVVLYIGVGKPYFETVGLTEPNGKQTTFFGPRHQFIESIQQRLDQLSVQGS